MDLLGEATIRIDVNLAAVQSYGCALPRASDDSDDWFLSYLDRLAEVTPEEVQRIAQTYMKPGNRVRGVYHPVEGQEVPA